MADARKNRECKGQDYLARNVNSRAGSAMTGCASTNTIAALLAGAVDAAVAERLEIHLDRCPACRRLVADLGRGLSALSEHGARGPSSDLPRPGATLGRYEILRAIGVGGMGVVYEAHDSTLDRRVALKLLRPDLIESDSLLAEARAMARLAHPNIVTVHDAGTVDGNIYVCMELVAGSTLRAWSLERERSWREIAHVYIAAGEGLAYVHRAGLVHRDFKPDNVLVDRLGPCDRERRVRVTDFGLARAIGNVDAQPAARSHVIAGTPAYMAPEQKRGNRIDARADQYAFCVSFREALGDTAPAWLARMLQRGLAVDRDDRYPTMDDLLARIIRRMSRKRRRVAVASVTIAAIVAFVASVPRPTTIINRLLVQRDANQMSRAHEKTPNASPRTPAPRSANDMSTQSSDMSRGDMLPSDVSSGGIDEPTATSAASTPTTVAESMLAARTSSTPRRSGLDVFDELTYAANQPNDVPAGPCDDSSPRTCAWFPPYCPATTIPAISEGCWTCADEQTCAPLGLPRTCNDGTKLRCSQRTPTCSGHRIAAIHDGCWTCADPFTCPSRPTITRSPQPPAGSNSGSNGTPTCGNGFCEIGEDHASCASDCCELTGSGGCAATCGNGMCEAGEDHASCANDCCELTSSGSCVPVCGNGFCEVGEDCPSDC